MSLDGVLADHAGVVSRAQLLEQGFTASQIRAMVHRRQLASIHRGVYVNHTGEPTWIQRAWAAVLATGPGSALGAESVLRLLEGPGRREADEATIHVVLDRHRHVTAPSGVRVHRRCDIDSEVLWNLQPPRQRLEQAVIDVAERARTEFDSVAVLARVVGARRTTAPRLQAAVTGRRRVARRRWLMDVLKDISDGTCSVLEHGFLNRVQRPHSLPALARQVREELGGRVHYRDGRLASLVVELDGRLFHDSTKQRDVDAERDLDVAVSGDQTVRILWGQVFRTPCRTAAKLAQIYSAHGWKGVPRPCGDVCEVRNHSAVG